MTPDDTTLQVLVITGNHTLVVGLTFLGRPWDVTAHADPDDVDATQADVVVVDLGTTQAGLDALARFTERPPAVVIGTDPVTMADGDQFIPRPFTLDELAATIEGVVAQHVGKPEPAGNRATMPGRTPTNATWVASRSPGARSVPGSRTDQQAGFWVLPGWALDDVAVEQDRERTLPEPVSAQTPAGKSSDESAYEASGSSPDDPPEEVNSDAESSVIDLAALEREEATRESARTVVRASQPREQEADEPRTGALKRLRSMATRTRDTIGLDPSLRRDEILRRFAQGVTAGGELETLLNDMPILGSVRALGAVIVEEVHTDLEADTTAYWQRFDDGFRVLASQGLTKVEERLVVALDQPMLGEVNATGGGLLFDPVDAVQAAVAGIGGAHTESFMAAAIAVGEGRYGLLAVGRDRPLVPKDLDRLIAIASEAAPGVAIAQLLRRVTDQVDPNAVHREQDIFAEDRTQKDARLRHADV